MSIELIDFYKADHRSQYPPGTEVVFSNWTARKSRIPGVDGVVLFGLQYFVMEYLCERWRRDFFSMPKWAVIDRYLALMRGSGINVTGEHLEALHDVGHLPLEVWTLPEGTVVPIGVPMMVMWNTRPEAFWLTNYLETSLSSVLWGPCTSATIAHEYRKRLDWYARESGGDPAFVDIQGHDFSYRGMYGIEAAQLSGAAHLLSFRGTDTVPAIPFLERYYYAMPGQVVSVPATEHSVMSMGGRADEVETFRRLITEVYPTGPVSIVSDTWDYWRVWTEVLPALRDQVLAREGTVVIRPDSGDPVRIICGDPSAPPGTPAAKGSFQLAWELFGGTINERGYRQLDPRIRLIYGDSITLERCDQICAALVGRKFVPTCVFGIGSYTYQYNTRDTFGFAVKATAGVVDDGTKRSARGLLAVRRDDDGRLVLHQGSGVTFDDVRSCEFQRIFKDGRLGAVSSLSAIRGRLAAERSRA